MRQTIFFFFIGIVAIAIYTSSSVRIELNRLILENAEALASGESSENIRCVSTGSVDCPINHSKVYAVFGGYRLVKYQ